MTRPSPFSSLTLPDFHPSIRMDLPWLLRNAVSEHGQRPFFTWAPFDGPASQWTYSEAYRDVLRLAGGLIDHGVEAGDRVLLHFENSPESLFFWLACGMIGAVAVPTNPRCAGQEIAYFAEKAGVVGAIAHPQFATMLEEHLPLTTWRKILEVGSAITEFGSETTVPERPADPAQPFCIQFSSGTTSRPKAIVWTHANVLWGAMIGARHHGLRSDDVTLIHSPMCHGAALCFQMLSSLWAGASMVLHPRFSASRFWETIVEHGCTWTLAADFIEVALRDVPVPPDHKLRFVVTFRRSSPSKHIWGLPNTSSHAMTETISHTIYSDGLGPVDEGALGRPSPEYAVRIVRADGSSAAAGESGELQVLGVRGISLFSEYLGDAEANDSAFTSDGYFKTGDAVRMREDGTIVFVERLKDMLKVGGENVAASEIEAIALAVDGCKEIAIVGQPHEFLGEVPYAFVIPHADAAEDLPARIVAACKQSLATFKVPRGVRVVDDFPRSTGGAKVVKAMLRQMLRDELA